MNVNDLFFTVETDTEKYPRAMAVLEALRKKGATVSTPGTADMNVLQTLLWREGQRVHALIDGKEPETMIYRHVPEIVRPIPKWALIAQFTFVIGTNLTSPLAVEQFALQLLGEPTPGDRIQVSREESAIRISRPALGLG